MTRAFSLGLLVFGLLVYVLLSTETSDKNIAVVNAWSPVAPPTMSVHAGYFSLQNHSAGTLELVAVSSPAYQSVEIHESLLADGVASMRRLPSLAIKAHENVQFESGGLHLMLRGPLSAKQVGDNFPVLLEFTGGNKVEFVMQVSNTGDVDTDKSSPDMHHHHHGM